MTSISLAAKVVSRRQPPDAGQFCFQLVSLESEKIDPRDAPPQAVPHRCTYSCSPKFAVFFVTTEFFIDPAFNCATSTRYRPSQSQRLRFLGIILSMIALYS